MTRSWLRVRRFVVHSILHADDTPHSIALGMAIAVFIAILPLVGIQTFLAVAIAALLRVNKAVCIPAVWISNPITMVPLYGGCLAFGRFLLGSPVSGSSVELPGKLMEVTDHSWLELESWVQLFSTLASLGAELWLGCFLIGLPVALISYPVTRWFISSHREKRRRRELRRQLYRAQIASRETTRQEVA